MHPDGYIKIKDRAKDIIISGGENISSIEVEDVLYRHPAVLAAAVVAKPDPKWGETPCAFVELKPGASATEAEIIEHCRASLARFKAPKAVVFGPLPKTSTGKIQKFVLRQQAEVGLGDRIAEEAPVNAPSKTEFQAPYVLRNDADGVATLTLNRGERLNPLSTDMLAAIQVELDRIAAEESVRVVILAGAGKHFCAGHDLREMRAHPDKAWQEELFGQCSRMMLALTRLPQPVIARVQGVAVAAGCQLVSMCDLAVASDAAQFALPGIKSGIFCSTPAVGVARNLSRKHALEMLFTGDQIDAATAVRWGLVNRAVPPAELDAAVATLARKIAAQSPAVVKLGKALFYRQAEQGLAEAYVTATEGMACNMMLDDAAEGIDAFLAKRSPDWKNR